MRIKLNHIEYEIEVRDNDLYFHIIWMDESFRNLKKNEKKEYKTFNDWEITSGYQPSISPAINHISLRGKDALKDNKLVIVREFNRIDIINKALDDWDRNYQFEDKVEVVMDGQKYRRIDCQYVGVNNGRKRFILELEEML